MKLYVLIFGLSALSLAAFSKAIDPADQKCSSDGDCQVVLKACACLHNSTCLDPDDQRNGYVDGVHKKFADRYQDLSKCSQSELDRCSTAGPCAMRGHWLPKCQAQVCTVVFESRVH